MRIYHERIIVDFTPDKKIQLATALNFKDGNGIALSYASESNLSEIYFKDIGLWPPGFAVFSWPFLKIGFSPIQAAFALEIFAILILFSSMLGIFRMIESEVAGWIIIGFFIFQAFTTSLYKMAGTTDLISFSLCLGAFYLVLKIINRDNSKFVFISFGIVSFLPSFFRFAYYPVSLLIPLLLISYCLFYDKAKIKSVVSSFGICSLLILLQLWYQTHMPTGISYLNEYHSKTPEAPYWENLSMFINLPIEMLADNYLVRRTLAGVHPYLFQLGSLFGWLLFICGFLLLVIVIIQEMVKNRKNFFRSGKNQFVAGGFFISCFIILFLILMSLSYPPEVVSWLPNGKWTYVRETRYFAVPLFLLPLIIIIKLVDNFKSKILIFTLLLVFSLSTAFSFVVNSYHIYKYGSGSLSENYAKYNHHSMALDDYIQQEKKSSLTPVLYTPDLSHDGFALYAVLHQVPLVVLESLERNPKTEMPVKIIVNWNESLDPEAKSILSRIIKDKNLQPVQEFSDIRVTLYELNLP